MRHDRPGLRTSAAPTQPIQTESLYLLRIMRRHPSRVKPTEALAEALTGAHFSDSHPVPMGVGLKSGFCASRLSQ